MNEIVAAAKAELDVLSAAVKLGHIKTGDIRSLSARLFRSLPDKSKEDVFAVCEELLEQRNWPMGVIAFDFAYRVKAQYDADTFEVFEMWLERYVRGWGDCDDFCTHAFGELIYQRPELSKKAILWTKRDEFTMRRAAAVVLIPSIFHDKHAEVNPLKTSDCLLLDEHDLVRKGYGWMLKILSTKEPQLVFDYLLKNKATMPRVAYRYALEKMDADKKKVLLAKEKNTKNWRATK